MSIREQQEHGGVLQPWQRGESGNPNGRPRKALKELQDKVGIEFNVSISRDDKFTILESMMEMSLLDLKSIGTDPRAPAFMAVIARAIIKDYEKGTMNTLDGLMDRFFGKPKQYEEVKEQEQEKEFEYEHPEAVIKLLNTIEDLTIEDLRKIANMKDGNYIDYEELK